MKTVRTAIAEYAELTKPRITLLCILMFIGGYFYSVVLQRELAVSQGAGHAGGTDALRLLFGLLGTWASVASANVLNMYMERKSDRSMTRTADRPLPSGRMSPLAALCFGLGLGVLSAVLLALVNTVTLVLGMIALLGYVLVYTPLKRVTPHALIIGAIPGAMPPLMGWTAHHGSLHPVGLALFGILLVWQVPHFVAIAIVHKDDYRRAGIKVLPVVAGERRAVNEALVYSLLLLVISLALVPLAGAGVFYALTASLLGCWMIRLCWQGRSNFSKVWARRVFVASLVYLPVLTLVLVVEVFARSLFRI
jgi:protoheme IX farnesyltransferase